MSIGEQPVMTDPIEAVRQRVLQEAADELGRRQGHHLGLAVMAIILPTEADLGVVERGESAVGDGDAMGVATEIGEHLLGAAEWRLGIDYPVDLT